MGSIGLTGSAVAGMRFVKLPTAVRARAVVDLTVVPESPYEALFDYQDTSYVQSVTVLGCTEDSIGWDLYVLALWTSGAQCVDLLLDDNLGNTDRVRLAIGRDCN